VLGNEDFELRGQLGEALRERVGRPGLDLAVGDVRQAVAVGPDQPPASAGERRVQAEDDQPNRSITSSEIS
jgi:hypothetical protein